MLFANPLLLVTSVVTSRITLNQNSQLYNTFLLLVTFCAFLLTAGVYLHHPDCWSSFCAFLLMESAYPPHCTTSGRHPRGLATRCYQSYLELSRIFMSPDDYLWSDNTSIPARPCFLLMNMMFSHVIHMCRANFKVCKKSAPLNWTNPK